MKSTPKLSVSEVFLSIQGEGPRAGQPSVFVRLAGCNLMCGGQGTQFDGQLHNGATWRCDTVEVWMQGTSKPVEQVIPEQMMAAIGWGANLVITGGEPLLQKEGVLALIDHAKANVVEIETNGTLPPIGANVEYRVSPKLSNSGNTTSSRYNAETLKLLQKQNAIFKFVISSEQDIEQVQDDFYFVPPPQVYLMPAGDSRELLRETAPKVAQLCIEMGYRYSPRLHIDIWNQKTGV